jgi:hypothetical protein
MNIYAPLWNNTSNTVDDHRNQTVQKRLASFRSTWRSTGVLNKRKGDELRAQSREFSLRRDSYSRFDCKLEKAISFDEVQRKL